MSDARTGRRQWAGDVGPCLGLGLVFLVLYVRTLCPTVYLGDVGDFCTAIATNGVPHPPGYPLFSLLGRLALHLIPWGEPAYRIGCVVAGAAAGCIAVLYLLIRELGSTRWPAVVAAATFGATYTFWSQSTRVEVYSLHLLFVSLALLGGLRYRRTGHWRDLSTAALAVSLGLAHHLTIVLVGPALLLLGGSRLWNDPGRGRRLALVAALLLVGPAHYLLLLLWAQADLYHSWGRTVTLPLLWNHATARIYRGLLAWPDVGELVDRLALARGYYTGNFPSLLWLLPLASGWLLWLRDRRAAASLLLVIGVVGAYNLCYSIDDIAPYYLPLWLIGAAFLGVGFDGMAARARRWNGAVVAASFLGLLPALLLIGNWSACDLSRSTWVREFARHKLEHCPANSVLITQGDQDRFPIWYVHDVLGVRPDITPLDRGFLRDAWWEHKTDPSLWYLHRLRRQGISAPIEIPSDRAARRQLGDDGYLIQLLDQQLRTRPLCLTFADTAVSTKLDRRIFFQWAATRFVAVPQGLIVRLQPRHKPVDLQRLVQQNESLWSKTTLPDLVGVRDDQDRDPNYARYHYACMLVNYGGLREMAGDRRGAAAIYQHAAEWAPDYKPAASALSAVRKKEAMQHNQPTEAQLGAAG